VSKYKEINRNKINVKIRNKNFIIKLNKVKLKCKEDLLKNISQSID